MSLNGMTEVKVYRVDPRGGTGDPLGGGHLVEPRVVVLDAKLAEELRPLLPEPSAQFRCGLAAEVEGTVRVEVIDARELHEGDDRMLALSLEHPSTLPAHDHPWSPCDVLRPRPWFC